VFDFRPSTSKPLQTVRPNRFAVAIFLGPLFLACGGSSSEAPADGGLDARNVPEAAAEAGSVSEAAADGENISEAAAESGLGAENIPDPGAGDAVDVAFQSVAPNDTPEDATPLGTSTMGDVTVWATNNTIGGPGNESNYFVFRSGPTSGTFLFRGCFGAPLTGMTATLWQVVDGTEQLPPVGTQSADVDNDGAEACLNFDQAVLAPNTVYLFGLTATGEAGLYSL
jgi:hypothetical protein